MSRHLKKYKIEVDKKEIMHQPLVIIIGLNPETNTMQLNIQGKFSIEEILDSLNTAQFELLNTLYNSKAKDPLAGIDLKLFKRDIYDRAVLGFSLMIDKFLPEAKDDKYEGFTNEAILQAQNDLLKKRIAAKKK